MKIIKALMSKIMNKYMLAIMQKDKLIFGGWEVKLNERLKW